MAEETFPSLKKRLLVRISIPVALAGILIALMAFIFAWQEIAEIYDAQLVHSAKVLLQMTEHEIVETGNTSLKLGEENSKLAHSYENKMTFRIWYKDRLVIESAKAHEFSNIGAPVGFSDQHAANRPWRFFIFVDPDTDIKVETAQRYAIRYELIGQLVMSLLLPALLFVPILFWIVWAAANWALKPVEALSEAVDRRHSDDLTAISTEKIPREVLPLVLAMNKLFARIADSIRREREFTDHAAHELRTPLAAMKTQAQVLMKKSRDQAEYDEGLENLHISIDRATHLVGQLLSLARLQNGQLPREDFNFSELLHDVIEDMRLQINHKKLNMQENIAPDVHVHGHADAVAILLRNLIDNAVKYTPFGGTVSVSLEPNGAFDIADTGPGLSDAEKEKVFERFTRLDKTGQSGSGLGLSIAQSIAEAHGVEISLQDDLSGGLNVHMQWSVIHHA